METYNSVTELAAGTGQSVWSPQNTADVVNAEFFGEPAKGGDTFDAEMWKDMILTTEEIVQGIEQKMKGSCEAENMSKDEIRRRVNAVVKKMIDRWKGDYANLKKRLLDIGVETISDSYLYDDHFEEKYGTENEN